MGQTLKHIMGRNQRFFANPEGAASYGTFVKPAATDAMKVLKTTMGVTPERKDRVDNRGHRDIVERITGKNTVTWSVEKYLIPSGFRGEAPDDGDIIEAAFGDAVATKDVGTITVVDYTQGSTDTITVTINGTATILTEGTDFAAETDNDTTADNIQAAVTALTGVTAPNPAAAIVTVTMDTGYNTLDLATGDASAWTVAVNDGEVDYTLTSVQGDLGSLSLVRHMDDIGMEAIAGAWVEEMKLTLSGGEEPKVTYSGGGAKHIHTGYTTLDGALTGETDPVVDDEYAVEVDSVIQIGTDDNSGAGFKVTVKVGTQLTIEAAATESDGVAIIPFTPADTTQGSAIAGILGSLNLAGAMPITAFEFTLKNGIKPINDEFGQVNVTDYLEGDREITGTISLRARRDQIIELGDRKSFATKALQVECGTAAGAIAQFNFDYVEIEFADLDVPESEEAMISLPFKALGSSGDDSMNIKFY